MFPTVSPCYLIFFSIAVTQIATRQFIISEEDFRLHKWSLALSDHWHVLGPFGQHAREQHFLSPSYPVDCDPLSQLLVTFPHISQL